jgi:ketosteroid isomerase-like protein
MVGVSGNHGTSNQLKRHIASADHAIAEENFDALMDFYTDDATLVIKPEARGYGEARCTAAWCNTPGFLVQ